MEPSIGLVLIEEGYLEQWGVLRGVPGSGLISAGSWDPVCCAWPGPWLQLGPPLASCWTSTFFVPFLTLKLLGQRVTAPAAQEEPGSLGLTEALEWWLVYVAESKGLSHNTIQQASWHLQGSALPVSHRCVPRLPGTTPVGFWHREESERGTSKNMAA